MFDFELPSKRHEMSYDKTTTSFKPILMEFNKKDPIGRIVSIIIRYINTFHKRPEIVEVGSQVLKQIKNYPGMRMNDPNHPMIVWGQSITYNPDVPGIVAY